MRVFLDTNVLVSAFVSRGLCADLLQTVLEKHDLLTSNLVLQELQRVLGAKLHAPKHLVESTLGVFDHVEVAPDQRAVTWDLGISGDDAAIVMAAVNAGAEAFITGDREILAAAGRVPMLIVTPRRFMEMLRSPDEPYPSPPETGGDPRVSDGSRDQLVETAFDLAGQIVGLCRELEESGNASLARALLRTGAGAGAALEGADGSSPHGERARLLVAWQRAHETDYWLRLVAASGVAPKIDLERPRVLCRQLMQELRMAVPELYDATK